MGEIVQFVSRGGKVVESLLASLRQHQEHQCALVREAALIATEADALLKAQRMAVRQAACSEWISGVSNRLRQVGIARARVAASLFRENIALNNARQAVAVALVGMTEEIARQTYATAFPRVSALEVSREVRCLRRIGALAQREVAA